MKINYDLLGEVYTYEQIDSLESSKLNFLLTNSKGDFANFGVLNNSCKFQGFSIYSKENELYKFIDEILVVGMKPKSITYGGYFARRDFISNLTQETLKDSIVDNIDYTDSSFDRFYLSGAGGMTYEIGNFSGEIIIDLDMRKLSDFEVWGRNYNVYKKEGVVFVEYTKKIGDVDAYKLYFGVKAINFSYELISEFVKKEYSYTKSRNSDFERYVYRLMKINISENKLIYFGAGFSEQEVLEQIYLLEFHKFELINYDKNLFSDNINLPEFKKAISQSISVAYRLSNSSIYKFLNKNIDKKEMIEGFYAGYPWFTQVWARDELVSIRAFINLGDLLLVKTKLFSYLNNISEKTGSLKRIEQRGSLESFDSVFILAKRFEDLIFYLEEKRSLNIFLTKTELELIFKKLKLAFMNITRDFWDSEQELLKVKRGDSWMDTIEVFYPLDIQVQFLNFVSFLAILSQILLKKEESMHFLDFEGLLKEKIKLTYLRNGILYNEPFKDNLTCNVFLAYYYYPDLFLKEDWESIFDTSLKYLKTPWNAISSLSKNDKDFQPEYTGENDKSYHMGDSWFWINNITAIVLDDLNEHKYRREIKDLVHNSTKDILTMGTIGFSSEVSSASSQKAQGTMAQLWSSATYIEMIDKIFEKKRK